jgi:hypothetical protein
MYIDLLIDVDNVVRFVIVRYGTLAAISSKKIDEVRPYLDEDALAVLQTTSKYLFVRNILLRVLYITYIKGRSRLFHQTFTNIFYLSELMYIHT